MATMESLHDVFVHELRDLYSAERQLIKALPKLAKNAGSPELADAFTNHLQQTEGHVTRLEEILQTLGVKAGGVKCKGMEGLLEEGAEVLEMDGTPGALDAAMIGAAQRVEHYEIAAYGTVMAWAKALGHDDVAQLLASSLEEEKAADKKLTELAEAGLNDAAMSGSASEDDEAEDDEEESTSNGSRGRQPAMAGAGAGSGSSSSKSRTASRARGGRR